MTDILLLYEVLKSTPLKYWIIRIKTRDASVIIPELRVKDSEVDCLSFLPIFVLTSMIETSITRRN